MENHKVLRGHMMLCNVFLFLLLLYLCMYYICNVSKLVSHEGIYSI